MPAPITDFVRVVLNIAPPPATPFSFAAAMGAFAHTVNTDRQSGPYFSLAEVEAAGFTAAASAEVHACASAVFAQTNPIGSFIVGLRAAGDADIAVSLAAIALEDSESFYHVLIDSRVDADIALASAWVNTQNGVGGIARRRAVFQSDDIGGTAAGVMQGLTQGRSSLIYHSADAEFLDAAWTGRCGGFPLDLPDGNGDWIYERLNGVAFSPITGAQATALYNLDANIYGRNKGYSFTSKGTSADGQFIDTGVTMDWLATRLEEAALATFVQAQGGIAFDNNGLNILASSAQGVLSLGVRNGHLLSSDQSTAEGAPRVTVPDVLSFSSAQRATRHVAMTASGTMRGSIQSFDLTVNLQF